VVDDGSTDNTAEVVAAFAAKDSRIQYVRQPNQRQAVAKNTAFHRACGRYIQFLDADDLLAPHKFERQVALLEESPEVDIVYGDVLYFDQSVGGSPRECRPPDFEMPGLSGKGALLLPSVLRNNFIVINSPLIRRRVLEVVGPFDAVLPPVEDWDFWLRCCMGGQVFRYLQANETQALVRSHPDSSSRNRLQMLRSSLSLRKKLVGALGSRDLLAINREKMAYLEGWLGAELLGENRLQALKHFAAATRLSANARWKMKWLLAALLSPACPSRWMSALLSSSLTSNVPLIGARRGGR
jgi:glycosyltransferase involved in cell wall biosynthesis